MNAKDLSQICLQEAGELHETSVDRWIVHCSQSHRVAWQAAEEDNRTSCLSREGSDHSAIPPTMKSNSLLPFLTSLQVGRRQQHRRQDDCIILLQRTNEHLADPPASAMLPPRMIKTSQDGFVAAVFNCRRLCRTLASLRVIPLQFFGGRVRHLT